MSTLAASALPPSAVRYLVIARDGPGMLGLRMQTRAEHVANLQVVTTAEPGMIEIGGPMLDADDNPNGSIFVFKGAEESHVRDLIAADPYTKHGVWSDIQIIRYIDGAAIPVQK